MSVDLRKIVEYSSYCINCVASMDKQRELARRVRTRARQLFQVLTYQGLPYLFAYVGGKAGERSLQSLYDVLQRGGNPSDVGRELAENIKNLRLSEEDASYALYGASMIYILSKITGRDFKKRLEELVYDYGFDKLIQKVSYEVAKWLKFFAEAKLPE
ncbi:MAG: type III-B CRISPR module-associated protein Cmr5 [Crenarchaeota archaeon]|nr:type III-B CRISPR module-associated protein Cmr5 [Thermoproteota archaeon]